MTLCQPSQTVSSGSRNGTPTWVEICSHHDSDCANRSSASWIFTGDFTRSSHFDETMFLKPLARLINDRAFSRNCTTDGVSFSTDLQLSHGHVPPAVSITILALPIVWTIILSIVTNRERRWTATLDSFAVFRLGGDWRGNFEEYRLYSLGRAREQVQSIPRNVVVDPVKGTAELGHGAGTRRIRRKLGSESVPLATAI